MKCIRVGEGGRCIADELGLYACFASMFVLLRRFQLKIMVKYHFETFLLLNLILNFDSGHWG